MSEPLLLAAGWQPWADGWRDPVEPYGPTCSAECAVRRVTQDHPWLVAVVEADPEAVEALCAAGYEPLTRAGRLQWLAPDADPRAVPEEHDDLITTLHRQRRGAA